MNNITAFSYTLNDLSALPKRVERSNKSTFGKVLCVCGSYGMAGASYFSAIAAYRTGAGLVEVFAPEENRVILQTLIPEAVLRLYDSKNPDCKYLTNCMKSCDTVVIGCGLGKSESALSLLSTVMKNSEVPTVLDADALNLLSENPSLLKYAKGKIITPHMGEMSRLTGCPISEIAENPQKFAYEFAKKNGVICVLKDHNTVISDGSDKIYVNNSGNSGMSTGGSGDLLTGVIGAICAMSKGSLPLMKCASLGVYIHGLAGDFAAKKKSEYSCIARDIADEISTVMISAF